jgi:two-component system CheB/CheR fusion protein
VGIGASAGGLEVLERFLAAVPKSSGFAYVVIQHLDPTHKALLAELLQRITVMPVYEATQSTFVEANTVYVIAPGSELTIDNGRLQVTSPVQTRGMRLPIDALFFSLARTQSEDAVGVVLSGMGSDGTLGLLAIKRQGGLTLAQTPESAQFDSMPRSAIAAGCVDIVGLPEELPERINRVTKRDRSGSQHALNGDPDAHMKSLRSILEMLRDRSRHDLSFYKTSTLLRRIERRMGVHGIASIAAYEDYLRTNPNELDLMFREMLIGVTAFFRDPQVWHQLKSVVIPELLARLNGVPALRAWVVGCSTGEEAYSLAMVFQEVVAELADANRPRMQIFASDLSAEAIEIARRGRYPKTIAADVGPLRLGNFFSEEADHFTVNTQTREMILFAQHDVIIDPPFTRLDLISCRNLLIYFNTPLQRRLMPLFRYCLKPTGVLLLGESETVGPLQSLFIPLSSKSRIYKCGGAPVDTGSVAFPVIPQSSPRKRTEEPIVSTPTPQMNLQVLVDQIILQQFSPAAVLVNDRGDILYINGRTGRYLEPAAGKADWNIHVMARSGIRARLAKALRDIAQSPTPIELSGLKVDEDLDAQVNIIVHAIRDANGLEGMALVVFRDVADASGVSSRSKRRRAALDPSLNEELLRSREEIHALRHETRTSKEELQAANEELQSTNEELQSANEELTTSKEEAQSMNEELQTLNNELRQKLDDLALAQSDMQNLLNSTQIATLFLDNELNVRRFTDQATRIVHLREVDIGRPLSELTSTLRYDSLESDAKETLRTLVTSEREISTNDDQWFSVRIMPYRTGANVIQGVVITFVNITAAKHLESRLRTPDQENQ